MKRSADRLWNRFENFVSAFFGMELLRSILTEDPSFFGASLQETDDLTDSTFYITRDFVVEFTGEVAELSDRFPLRQKKKIA